MIHREATHWSVTYTCNRCIFPRTNTMVRLMCAGCPIVWKRFQELYITPYTKNFTNDRRDRRIGWIWSLQEKLPFMATNMKSVPTMTLLWWCLSGRHYKVANSWYPLLYYRLLGFYLPIWIKNSTHSRRFVNKALIAIVACKLESFRGIFLQMFAIAIQSFKILLNVELTNRVIFS